jgi:hypothetical protein
MEQLDAICDYIGEKPPVVANITPARGGSVIASVVHFPRRCGKCTILHHHFLHYVSYKPL